MSMTWFKLHHELPGDYKLRKFSPQQKWAWVVLLCIASNSKDRGIISTQDEEGIADYCDFESLQDFQFFLDKLRQKGMIEPITGGLKISNWENRQYEKPSDRPQSVRERVAKHRAKKKEESDVTVTPCNAMKRVGNAMKRPVTHRLDKTRLDKTREDLENMSLQESDLLEERPAKTTKAKKRVTAEGLLKETSTENAQLFYDWWKWYRECCDKLNSASGSKAAAAKAWLGMIETLDVDTFRRGCSAWFRQSSAKSVSAPHAKSFLEGKAGHPEPYWLIALEASPEPGRSSSFLESEASPEPKTGWTSEAIKEYINRCSDLYLPPVVIAEWRMANAIPWRDKFGDIEPAFAKERGKQISRETTGVSNSELTERGSRSIMKNEKEAEGFRFLLKAWESYQSKTEPVSVQPMAAAGSSPMDLLGPELLQEVG